jgi:hypothetical protein
MEQQFLHLKVLKSLNEYFNQNKWESNGDPLVEASKPFIHPLSISAAILDAQQRPKSSLGSIKANNKVRPQSRLGETARPRWH